MEAMAVNNEIANWAEEIKQRALSTSPPDTTTAVLAGLIHDLALQVEDLKKRFPQSPEDRLRAFMTDTRGMME